MFVVTVSSTDPIFFYCGQVGHCKSGMVGVVNPSSSQTLDSYKSAAAKAASVGIPASVAGGKVEPNAVGSSSAAPSATGTAAPGGSKTTTRPATSPTAASAAGGNPSKADLALRIWGSVGVMALTQALARLL